MSCGGLLMYVRTYLRTFFINVYEKAWCARPLHGAELEAHSKQCIVCMLVCTAALDTAPTYVAAAMSPSSPCSNVSEAVIFLFLGISLYESRSADPVLIVLCILFCVVFRPLCECLLKVVGCMLGICTCSACMEAM